MYLTNFLEVFSGFSSLINPASNVSLSIRETMAAFQL